MTTSASLGRIGVVANPCAGAGPEILRAVLERLFQRFRGADVVVNADTFEAAAADAQGLRCARVRGETGDARRLSEAVLDAGVDTIIGLGGDGTLGEIGLALAERTSRVRLLGIGMGSSNVGPLVAATAGDVDALFDHAWVESAVHALDVRVDGRRVGIAFHDVTPAATYFGTRDGRRVDLDAQAAFHGVDREKDPASVCRRDTWVAKNGRRALGPGAFDGGQVVASPLNDVDECRGKAVSGFLCWGPYVGCLGVVAVSSAVLIRTRLSIDDLVAAEPLCLFHLGLAPGDVVEVGGLSAGAIVVDGTPRAAAAPESLLSVQAMERAVKVLRCAPGRRGARGEARCATTAS